MDRQRLTNRTGFTVKGLRRINERPEYLEFLAPSGRVLFSVKESELFDAYGNYFEVNVE